MPLAAGAHFGPYEILVPLGAGGMGEVYKARDTRLDRLVAIKVLPPHIAKREDLRQRFEREARAVSSLKHPHICVLYDIGRQDGVDYMVMEHLEGETLAARLSRGALPLEQALTCGAQAGDALDRAHRTGVIHRDVKPANIMLTRDGVKVLDFGLAKTHPKRDSKAAEADATLTEALTTEGTILGTPQYMAPEQFEGKEADARTDIFGFGCLLYEMVTGKRAFDGKTKASVVGAILGAEPPSMSALQPVTPARLERLVRRCMVKDPEERFQSMWDVLLELRSIGEQPQEAPAARAPQGRWKWGVAAALLVAVGTLAGWLTRPSEEVRSYQLPINPPDKTIFLSALTNEGGSVISPDGRTLAFSARTEGRMQLWVRRLDSMEARPLPGTEGAYYPFWSPDSRFIGFFAGGKLKKIEVAGGPAQTICDAQAGRGGAWGSDGVILFSAVSTGRALHRVAAAGGASVALTTLGDSENAHYWPHFLPDGRRFLYTVRTVPAENSAVWAGTLELGKGARLLAASSNVAYAPPARTGPFDNSPGHLLFARERTLMAQPFDAAKLEARGDPFPVAEQVGYAPNIILADFSVSTSGILVHGPGGTAPARLAWRDRSGRQLSLLETSASGTPSLSPDGKRLAFVRLDTASGNVDIWVAEVERGTVTRFTFGAGFEDWPVWSPDGSEIAFTSFGGGDGGVYSKASSGAGEEQRLTTSGMAAQRPSDWSPDRQFLLITETGPKTGLDLMILPLTGDRKPAPFLRTQFAEGQGRFSPDGRWIAYTSEESGTNQVYVQAFTPGKPASGARWQVSSTGGSEPRWRGDGKELFYRSQDGKLTAASVKTDGEAFQSGTPVALFDTRILFSPLLGWTYDVTRDGQRFIVLEPVEQTDARPLTLMIQWQAGVRR